MHYISWSGLTSLADRAKGNEKVGVGIRPYGLHAGNLAAVVAYPYLFFERFEKHGNRANFTFQVWLNDTEPVTYVGADNRRDSADWANMYPGSTSFQATPAPDGFQGNLVDFWQPAIEGVVRGTIGAQFPNVILEFRRASELVVTPEFEKMIIGCIEKADEVREIINRWNVGVAKVAGPSSFVWPLDPLSNQPLMNPRIHHCDGRHQIIASEESISDPPARQTREATRLMRMWLRLRAAENLHQGADTSQTVGSKEVRDLMWAVQFRMLHAARLAATKPDIWFMGMDHVPTNLGSLMQQLASLFKIPQYQGHFLHAPLLFAGGDRKLSKSLGNAVHIPINRVIAALRSNWNAGLDVSNAFSSEDIMAIGAHLLPFQFVGHNRKNRLENLNLKRAEYEKSGKLATFRSDNRALKISERKIAKMLGVPHLN